MKKLLMLLCVTVLFSGCEDIYEEGMSFAEEQAGSENGAPRTRAGGIVSFEKMPNPYKLEVMQAVYDSLSIEPVFLQPTNLYVRIRPQNSDQLHWLWDDSGLELFPYPLDIKMNEGQEYVDPTIPEGELGWLYTTVKPDFVFQTEYVWELLEYCYIPEEGETIETRVGTRAGEENNIASVEKEAFERLGYVIESEPQTRSENLMTGTIRVYDDSNGVYVPLKGVLVRCHVLVNIDSARTDENGYYDMETYFLYGNMQYDISFSNSKDFKIWSDFAALFPATYGLGSQGREGVSKDIERADSGWEYAVVNNAAYDYYEQCGISGVTTPPASLKISVVDNVTYGSAPMLRRVHLSEVLAEIYFDSLTIGLDIGSAGGLVSIFEFMLKLLAPDVIIGTDTEDTNGTLRHKTYREFFYVVSHELSHASHFSRVCQDNTEYWEKYIRHIVSSFADSGTSYGYTTKGPYFELCGIGEIWGYAMGRILENEYYGVSIKNVPYSDYEIKAGRDGAWIKPHAFWDLYRNGVLTKWDIFRCLTPDVDTYNELIGKMCEYYPNKKDVIIKTFSDYGIRLDNIVMLSNREILSDTSVYGQYIFVANVHVRGTAKLTLVGTSSVTIGESFIVDENAGFEIVN